MEHSGFLCESMQALDTGQDTSLDGTAFGDETTILPDEEPNPSRRNVGPSPEQWAHIRGIFKQLYIGEGRKLRVVREILARDHGFEASEKMYKRHINEWKIRKNYKRDEKTAFAKQCKALVESGQSIRSLSFQGRPVKLDRIKRHCRTDKELAQLCEHLVHSPSPSSPGELAKVDTPSTATTRYTPAQNSGTQDESDTQMDDVGDSTVRVIDVNMVALPMSINLPTDDYNLQSTLSHTQQAVEWQFTAFTPLKLKELRRRFPDSITKEVSAGCVDPASAFWLALHHGLDNFGSGRFYEGRKSVSEGCEMVRPLIMSAPLHLLSCILLHFATSWQGFDDLEQSLLCYVYSMANKVLGPQHPLTKALMMVATTHVRDGAVDFMMAMIVQGYTDHRKADSSSVFALRVDQIDMLRKRRKFEQAQSLCEQLIHDSRPMKKGKRYRTALAARGRLSVDQNQDVLVDTIAREILHHEATDPVPSNSGGTTTWACDQLAALSLKRGDHEVAEVYLRRGACISYQRYSHRGPSTRSFVEQLRECMHQRGKNVSIRKVCDELGICLEHI